MRGLILAPSAMAVPMMLSLTSLHGNVWQVIPLHAGFMWLGPRGLTLTRGVHASCRSSQSNELWLGRGGLLTREEPEMGVSGAVLHSRCYTQSKSVRFAFLADFLSHRVSL